MRRMCFLVVGVLAVGVWVGTSSASAESVFTASEVGATIYGEAEGGNGWTITGSEAKCTEVSFAGVTEAAEAETLRVVPTYKSCTAFGFSGTVSNENCVYVISSGGKLTIEPVAPKSSCQFVISVSNVFAKCKAVVKNQSLSPAVSFGSSIYGVQMTFGATKVSAEVVESSGLCPLTLGSHGTATYGGKSIVSAKESELRWHASTNRFIAGSVGKQVEETTLTQHRFDLGAFPVICENVGLEGSTEGIESSTFRLTPTYSKCGNAFYAITIVNEYCRFAFHATGSIDIEAGPWGKPCQIRMTVSQGQTGTVCKLVIQEQNLDGVGYANGESDLVVSLNLSISAEVTESKGECWMPLGNRVLPYTVKSTLQAAGTTFQWAA